VDLHDQPGRQLLSAFGPERWLLVVLVAALLVGSLDWGLPSAERVEVLLSAHRLSEEDEESLTVLRERHYSGGQVDRPSGAELSGPERIEALRAFLIGSAAVDERKPYSALSRMDPWRLDLDPGIYIYGGSFLYPIGGLIVAADRLGWLTIHRQLHRYVERPQDAARLYLIGRAVSTAAYLGVLVLLGPLGDRLGGRMAGSFAMLTWSLSTVALNQGVVTKPHVYAAFWSLLAVGILIGAERGSLRRVMLAGAAAGLAAGASLAAGVAVVMLPLLIPDRDTRWARARRTLLLWGAALGAFLLSNPYLPFVTTRFAAELVTHGSADGWGYANVVLAKLPAYLAEVARGYAAPLSILGLVAAPFALFARSRQVRRLGAFFLLHLLVVGLSLANLRISLFLGPILCLFVGLGARWLWRAIAARSGWVAFLVLVLLSLPGMSFAALFARDTLRTPTWAPGEQRWLRDVAASEERSFGIYPPLHPVKVPPFPFVDSRVVRLDRFESPVAAPRWVVVGNHEGERDRWRWERHPLRSRYDLVLVIGSAPLGEWARSWRVPNQAYKVAWVYQKR